MGRDTRGVRHTQKQGSQLESTSSCRVLRRGTGHWEMHVPLKPMTASGRKNMGTGEGCLQAKYP